MGNFRSKPKLENSFTGNLFVTLSFQKDNKLEIISLKLVERKIMSDLKFNYFKLDNKEKKFIEQNMPFTLTVIDKNNKEHKYNFDENYRVNDRDYTITTNVIEGYKWRDYSPGKYKYVKIRHNKWLEPEQVIISE